MSGHDDTRTRLRLHFGKRGPLRYTSHLDLARIWERLLRRAGVSVVYSHGFNPRPKIQLAAALPLGYTSACEVLDVWLAGDTAPPLQDLLARLRALAPQGLEVQRAEVVDLRGPALQTLTREAVYRITLLDPIQPAPLRRAVAGLLNAQHVMRQRRGKTYDLRPLVSKLELIDDGEAQSPTLLATLSLRETATGRPDELLAALGLEATRARVERVAIHFEPPDPA